MAQIFVEGWAPEYGAPYDPDDELAPAEGAVDPAVERDDWSPIEGKDDGESPLTFVDGVRRIDARLTVDDPDAGPVPGLCGSLGVGAVRWDRDRARSEVVEERVERLAVLAEGRSERFPPVDLDPPYRTTRTPAEDPSHLVRHLHTIMRRTEGAVASRLGEDGCVIADGPLNDLAPKPVVGYVKTHRVTYLDADRNRVVARLRAGQRTPLFTIADYKRYSWYVRLADLPDGHSWTGIVRCEASGALPERDVRALADRTAAVLPLVASRSHLDPRAPQNLVPIGALERRLRHRLGDPGLVYRALRAAVMEEAT